jgi:hypothetical protein
MLAAAALGPAASADEGPQQIGATLAPASVPAGTFALTATFTNGPGEEGTTGVNLLVPTAPAGGLTVTGVVSVTSPSGTTWTAAMATCGDSASSTACVQLRGSRLGPGQSVAAVLDVTSAASNCSGQATTYTWDAQPLLSEDGGDLREPASLPLTTTVADAAGPTHLAFAGQIATAVAGTPITTTTGSPVEVDALNRCGAPAASSAPVTITLSGAASGMLRDASPFATTGPLSGGGPVTPANGRAQFPALTINAAGQGFTLTASDGVDPAATSPSFTVNGAPCTAACTPTQPAQTPAPPPTHTSTRQSGPPSSCTQPGSAPPRRCSTSKSTETSGLAITATGDPRHPSTANLVENTDVGRDTLSCALTVPDPSWYQYSIDSQFWRKTLVYTREATLPHRRGDGDHDGDDVQPAAQLCYGSTADFLQRGGRLAPHAKLPNAAAGFIGLLPNCGTRGATVCIRSRRRIRDAADAKNSYDLQVAVFVPEGIVADPWARCC